METHHPAKPHYPQPSYHKPVMPQTSVNYHPYTSSIHYSPYTSDQVIVQEENIQENFNINEYVQPHHKHYPKIKAHSCASYSDTAIILVLFILLVIISRAWNI